jgi:hypothetical protein
VAEWLKAHAWKACIWQHIEGSNPFLSAKKMRFERSAFFISERLANLFAEAFRYKKGKDA